MENAIYDPATQRTAPNGQTIRDPFPNNIIPINRMDPIALKIQSLIPQPANPNAVVSNLVLPWSNPRFNAIPSIKLDHSLNTKTKLSFFTPPQTRKAISKPPIITKDIQTPSQQAAPIASDPKHGD